MERDGIGNELPHLRARVADVVVPDPLDRARREASNDPGVQRLRRHVGPVRPDDGSELGVEADTAEVGGIGKRLEDTPPLPAGEIDLTLGTVLERQPQPMIANDLDRRHVNEICHSGHLTASGAIGSSG